MYRERILEEKKRLNMSTKTMSERSVLHLPEETISRFLTGKSADPHVSTVLDSGATVGLAPYEIFMDATTAQEFRLFLAAKLTNIDNAAELELLRIKTAEQEQRITELEAEVAQKASEIKHQAKIIKVYDHFIKIDE